MKHPEPNEIDSHLAVECLLLEYQTLRTESLESIGHRIQIVNFTFAAMAVIVAGLAASHLHWQVTVVLGVTLLPMMAFAAAFIWLGEHQRSQRAGRGLSIIEHEINELVGVPNLLRWESALSAARVAAAGEIVSDSGHRRRRSFERGVHMKYPYVAAAVVLFSSGVLGQVLSVGTLALSQNWTPELLRVGAPIVLALACVTIDAITIRDWLHRWVKVSAPDS